MKVKYMNFLKGKGICFAVIGCFCIANICDAGKAVLPEGLIRELTDEMRRNGGGGGLLGDVRDEIQFDSEFVSSNSVCIRIQFWGDGSKIAEVKYFPDYLMYGLRLEGGKNGNEDWIYASFTPKWLFYSIKARNFEGEKLLQPELPPDILDKVLSFLKASSPSNVIAWSYSAVKETTVISLYKMRSLGTPNITGTAEYFPSMGIYRWTFQSPGAGCEWNYIRWPMNILKK